MARIPEQVVERLKTEVSVRRLAEARGVALTKHGAICTAGVRSMRIERHPS